MTHFLLSEVVGYYLMQPLATLIEGLKYADPPISHFHSPVTLESGYAAASIPVGVAALESFTNLVQYLLDPSHPLQSPMAFVRDKYPNSRFAQELPEILAVRHSVIHTHMWRREISLREEGSSRLQYSDIELHEGFGHPRSFFPFVDLDRQRTKILNINVIPTRLTTDDVAIVMHVILDYLLFLDEQMSTELNRDKQSIINIANQFVVFHGQVLSFPDMVRAILPSSS